MTKENHSVFSSLFSQRLKQLAVPVLCSLPLWMAGAASAAGTPPATLRTEALATPFAARAAQWIADDAFWPGADALISGKQGLALLDRKGALLARLPGNFEAIDSRARGANLLVAAVDVDRQQAVLATVSAQARAWRTAFHLPRPEYKIDGLCLYRDEAGNDFVFLVGEEGMGDQWLVAQAGMPLEAPLHVRRLSLPPDAVQCHADDEGGWLYVNEESVGLWAYEAHPEAPLVRRPVDLLSPFGALRESADGMSALAGSVLALDAGAGSLHRYVREGGGWQALPALALDGVDGPERVHARDTAQGTDLLLAGDDGVRRARLAWRAPAPPPADMLPVLPAAVQTDPVSSLGDAADDPAIWVHPADAGRSLVLGTDKQGGLMVYDLRGKTVQDLRAGRLNNVDVRTGFEVAGRLMDVAVATNRDHNSLHVFAIDRESGVLSDIGQVATPLDEVYGVCLYKDRGGAIHAILNDKDGRFLQYRLSAPSGKAEGELVRRFATATQPEGCVAHEQSGQLFVGEEDVAVWVLDAEPDAPATLRKVIDVGGIVHDDIEGLAVYQGKTRSYLIVSSQGNSSYVVLDAQAPYAVRGAFRIGMNAPAGIDGVSETDGTEVTSADLGGIWQRGMFVAQDGRKRMPEGRQNYKYLPWADIADALGLED